MPTDIQGNSLIQLPRTYTCLYAPIKTPHSSATAHNTSHRMVLRQLSHLPPNSQQMQTTTRLLNAVPNPPSCGNRTKGPSRVSPAPGPWEPRAVTEGQQETGRSELASRRLSPFRTAARGCTWRSNRGRYPEHPGKAPPAGAPFASASAGQEDTERGPEHRDSPEPPDAAAARLSRAQQRRAHRSSA